MNTPDRPILRYHGGKWILAPWIVSHFPKHRIYVEPFGGAASVLLRKPRSYAEIYNDLDGELVNLFQVCRENGEALIQVLRLTPFSRADFEKSYQPAEDTIEQARRTVIRSFMGFGSNAHNKKTGFRVDSFRSGTTPARDWKNYPDCLRIIIQRLRGVAIENRDAIDVILQHDSSQTLFYVDPPYVSDTRDRGEDYRFEMTDDQHEQLAEVLHGVQGMVVLSGYNSNLYGRLYSSWRIEKKISLADGAREREEILWFSPSVPEINPRLFNEIDERTMTL